MCPSSASRLAALALACALPLAACRKAPPPDVPDVLGLPGAVSESRPVAPPPAPPAPPPLLPEPADEPPEAVLVDLLRRDYARINEAGGLPVTVTASGRNAVLRPELHQAQKTEPCRRLPASTGGAWECTLSVMITLQDHDRKPGASSERLHVYWDGVRGAWASGTPPRQGAR